MKKIVSINIVLFIIGIFSFVSCNKSPTFSSNTVATPNSTLIIGDSCWTYDSCNVNTWMTASGGYSMTGTCGTTTVLLHLGGGAQPLIGSAYALTSGVPTAGQARLFIVNPPSQPSGTWVVSGFNNASITVTTGLTGYSATFTNLNCTKYTIYGPTVTASGTVICH